jgi:TetR/AcrR family transcriptional repressor of nem operon
MGHSQAEKAESRRKILTIASREVRARGFAGIAVGELMRAAGLTHGGFYGHFASRDGLIAEAFERAVNAGAGDAVKPGEAALSSANAPSLRAWVRSYLSRAHRDAPGTGCALAALAGEVAREDRRVRTIFTRALRTFVAGMSRLTGGEGAAARRQGLAAASTMIGALILARAVDDEALSDEILMAAKQSILAQEHA